MGGYLCFATELPGVMGDYEFFIGGNDPDRDLAYFPIMLIGDIAIGFCFVAFLIQNEVRRSQKCQGAFPALYREVL